MAQLPRISPVGIPVHLIQRGNNRQACFGCDEDHVVYAELLKEYSQKYNVAIHAWVMMTNHVHLLCTPGQEGGVSRMMQALGRRYVQYFNSEYRRTGTLWEGRFRSCIVQAERYLLEVYRYIELNQMWAGMVAAPGEYHWSSYQVNGLGMISELCTPHHEYIFLDTDREERQKKYRELFRHHVAGGLLDEIRSSTHKWMAVGNDRFKQTLEALTGRQLKAKKRGRPVGWRKNESLLLLIYQEIPKGKLESE